MEEKQPPDATAEGDEGKAKRVKPLTGVGSKRALAQEPPAQYALSEEYLASLAERISHCDHSSLAIWLADKQSLADPLGTLQPIHLSFDDDATSHTIAPMQGIAMKAPSGVAGQELYLNAGGPIWSIAFAPTTVAGESFLAVGVTQLGTLSAADGVNGVTDQARWFGEVEGHDNVLQVWRVSGLVAGAETAAPKRRTGVSVSGKTLGRPRKEVDPEKANAPPKPRGRPRKHPVEPPGPPKKKGRPRKYPRPDDEPAQADSAVKPKKAKAKAKPKKGPADDADSDAASDSDVSVEVYLSQDSEDEDKDEVGGDEVPPLTPLAPLAPLPAVTALPASLQSLAHAVVGAGASVASAEADAGAKDEADAIDAGAKEDIDAVDAGAKEEVEAVAETEVEVETATAALAYGVALRGRGSSWQVAWSPHVCAQCQQGGTTGIGLCMCVCVCVCVCVYVYVYVT
ncbi:hypothetical protein B484DRAFT_129977 [Ochromonadaceae sp. CCMP2298]|nr:hypothetical protein B484DRAFT_129977 [Ochromonadaceae sp. CCMP2298]